MWVCEAYKCLGCCWKGEQIDEDHWEARMSVAACLQVSQHACPCVMWCERMPVWVSRGLSLIAWLTAAAFHAHECIHSHPPQPAQRCFLKSLPPFGGTKRHACHLSSLPSEPSALLALVSSGGGTLPGRRYDTVSLHTGLDSSRGRGQASRLRRQSGAVNGCLSWQIDHPASPLPQWSCTNQCIWILVCY